MHQNAKLIEEFYQAFQRRDYKGMGACYHDEVVFSDPAFGELRGAEARAMWHMLTTSGSDLKLTFKDVQADDRQGSAAWDAHYTFSSTGRAVHNVIKASFGFRDGLIVRHQDVFDLWRWEAQALGLVKGQLLGWLPPVQNAVRKQARARLDAFMTKHAAEYRRSA